MTLQTKLFARVSQLGAATRFRVRVERDLRVFMPDGVALLTDRWFSEDGGIEDPVVVFRTPYGRRESDLIARLLTERGFNVVVQSCRGTFGSEGEFTPFLDEAEDGAATLEWLSEQKWAAGELLLFGVSYLGFTAWTMKRISRRPIGAMALGVTSTDFRRAVMYPSGRFGLATALAWRYQLRNRELTGIRLRLAMSRLMRIVRGATPGGIAQGADLLAFGEPDSHYRNWLSHGPDDPWWNPLDLDDELEAIPPLVQVCGWYDLFLDAQVHDTMQLVANEQPVRLVIGPWTHGSPGLAQAMMRETLDLFAGVRHRGGARIWFGGDDRWEELPAFPPETTPAMWILGADGSLGGKGVTSTDARRFRANPTPSPAHGGRTLFPADAGRKNQAVRERRTDILLYTSEPLTQDTTIAGWPTVQLVTQGTDTQPWFARLCDVSPKGRSHNVCDGTITSSAPLDAPRRTVEITMSPTAYVFKKGHRVRIQISADASPTYAADPFFGGARVVICDKEDQSRLVLPLLVTSEIRPRGQSDG